MKPRGKSGFTLVEALTAAVILALVVAAIAQSIGAGVAETNLSLRNARGTALAEALMEEILSKPYADPNGYTTPGPDAGETTRQLYNNIDDYHGFSETANNLQDQSGTALPTEYQSFTRSATCVYGSTTVTGLGTLTGITITVTVVTSTGDTTWTVTRFVPDPSQ